MSAGQPQVRFTGECAAPPEAVYDLLADLRSHLEWAGTGQSSDFRLLSMEAPAAAAAEGTRFASTGAIPMSARRWRDESVVTEAIRPSAFEFVTHATAGSTVARYRHRYQVAASTSGSRVAYTMTQELIERPMLRLGVPGLRTMMWRFAIPMFAGRGFRNLLAEAASMAPVRTAAAAGIK